MSSADRHGSTVADDAGVDAPRPTAVGDSTCPECPGRVSWVTDYELVCEDCGLVVAERHLDFGPEWRSYPEDAGSQERTGAPESFLRFDKGLSTDIDWRNRDAAGRSLSPEMRRQMTRLRRLQRRAASSVDDGQNLQVATAELSRMASRLGVPRTVAESAAMVYRRALEADLLIGRSIEGVATASLYVACRLEGVPRSLDEFAAVARTDRTTVARMYRLLVRELDLPVRPVDPRDYVARYCSQLDLDADVEATAVEIIEDAIDAGVLAGKSPTGFAAAAVYLAAKRRRTPRTQAAVATVAGVSTMTIRSHYQEQLRAVEA